MNKYIVMLWEEGKAELRKRWAESFPEDYEEIVKGVAGTLFSGNPQVARLTTGGYSGVDAFLILTSSDEAWAVSVDYGSCSACDSLAAIQPYGETPTEDQMSGLMTLALHIVQAMNPVAIA